MRGLKKGESMSSKLIKQPGNLIEFPNDAVILDLKVYISGKIQLQAPVMAPQDVSKYLQNIAIDVMFAALSKSQESTGIVAPQGREEAHEEFKSN